MVWQNFAAGKQVPGPVPVLSSEEKPMQRWSSAVLFLAFSLGVGAAGCDVQTSVRYSSSGFSNSSSSTSSTSSKSRSSGSASSRGDDDDEQPRAAEEARKKKKSGHKGGGD